LYDFSKKLLRFYRDEVAIDQETRDKLRDYAQALALDLDAFDKALDGSTHAAEIQADVDAANGLGPGPFFIVTPRGGASGYLVRFESPSRFRRVIDQALREARAGGTSPATGGAP